MLDASHVSCHTYADEGAMSIDAFTCGDHSPEAIIDCMSRELDLGQVSLRVVDRFI